MALTGGGGARDGQVTPSALLSALMTEGKRIETPFLGQFRVDHIITVERAVAIYSDLIGGEFPTTDYQQLTGLLDGNMILRRTSAAS